MRWYASLRRPGAFARVRQRGKRVGLPTLRAFALARRQGPLRVGITVPGSVGPAVARNLVRRRVQGALDGLALDVRPNGAALDLVFVMQPAALTSGFAALASEVAVAVARLSGGAAQREASR